VPNGIIWILVSKSPVFAAERTSAVSELPQIFFNSEKGAQDERKLRHYKKCGTIERFIAWLHNFQRCVVRYQRKASII